MSERFETHCAICGKPYTYPDGCMPARAPYCNNAPMQITNLDWNTLVARIAKLEKTAL